MRERLLEFELGLDREASEAVVAHDWGRAFLSPTLPLAWDANWILIDREGMTVAEVAAAAEDCLGGYAHRAVAIRDEAEGERLAAEVSELPGWEVERDLYMLLGEEAADETDHEVAEMPLRECEELRRKLIREVLDDGVEALGETTEQLLEMERRCGAAAGDRWFLAPPDEPASACCLLGDGEIGQVEDVGTLAHARGRGLAKAVVRAAIAASREAGHRHTFVVADADDWPRLLYERLGFATCGVLHVLRRPPTAGTTA